MKACVAGLGRIGLGYDLESKENEIFSHTKALMLHPDFELVCGVDPSGERRKEFTDFSGKPAFPALADVDRDIEMVVLSVPTSKHLEAFQDAIKLSPRIVILEKPIAATRREAEEIIALAKKHGISLYINYMRRVDPGIKAIGERVRHSGKLIAGNMFYSRGLVTNGSHFLGILIDWLGLPERVNVISGKAAKNVTADREVNFNMFYKDAIISVLAGDDSCYTLGEVDLLLEKGRFRLTGFGEKAEIYEPRVVSRNITRIIPSNTIENSSLARYQYNVLEDVLAGNFDDNVKNAFDTLCLCEKINDAGN